MPRPRLRRRVSREPYVTFYKPRGVPLRSLEVVEVTLEEWEALRLRYSEGLDQTSSAVKMKTSQSTLQRIVSSAHEKICNAIISGKAIRIVQHM